MRLSIQLAGQTTASLLHLPPKQRDQALRKTLSRQLHALRRRFPSIDFIPRGKGKASWTIDADMPASQIVSLAARREVKHVMLDTIEGRRRKPSKPSLGWFCVWSVLAVQIEDQVAGSVTLEDRLELVKANSAGDAKRCIERKSARYGAPYMNSEGYLVRWQLISIQDVYALLDQTIDPRGTEVYSRLRAVRMRPEYRWHPRKQRSRTPAAK